MSGSTLTYGIQTDKHLIGTRSAQVALTTSFTDTQAILVTASQVIETLYIDYTPSTSGNSIQLQLEGSPSVGLPTVTPDFYNYTNIATAAGVNTVTTQDYTFVSTGTTNMTIRIPVNIADRQIRFSLKETVGSGAAGTAALRVLMGPTS